MKRTVWTLVLTLICILSLTLGVAATDVIDDVDPTETSDLILGDVDGDGQVTNADVLLIYRYIYNAELYPLPTRCSHRYSDWTVITPTACDADGVMIRVCSKCMDVEEATVAGGHVFGESDVCQRCGYSTTYIPSVGLQYTTNKNGTCYVSGIGTCTDSEIVIPTISPDGDVVTSIGKKAFNGCTSITSVIIPDSVSTINSYAFYGCISLGNIKWSNTLSEIGDYAFYGCTSLTSVEFPDSMKKIGEHAFNGCTLLDKITLNDGLTTLDIEVFANTAITELIIPDSVTTISYSTNYNYSIVLGCQKLKKVVVGSGMSMVTPSMFRGLTALEEVVIGPNVKTIGAHAFDGCSSLASIVIPDNVTAINNYAFQNCINLQEITWSNSLSDIGTYAFYGCTSLTSVELPDSMKKIGDSAFNGCTLLDTIILNEGLTTLDENAFANTAITELIIPNSVTTISYSTNYNYSIVEGCNMLKRVVIGTGMTKIPAYMFQSLPALEEVVIGPNVKTICVRAFEECNALTSIVIPNNVTAIESRAFQNCINLQNITWSNSLSDIGTYAFYGCTSLTSVELPDSMKKIGDSAFNGCTLLDTIILNEGLTTLDENAFANTAITELIIPNSVTTISYSTNYNYSIVEGCNMLKRVVIGTGMTKIPAYMFQSLPALEEVVIGPNVKTICEHAFDECNALTSIVIPNNVTAIESRAFQNCINLQNITWSNALSEIGTYAFNGCTSLTSVKLPASVKVVDDYAFNGCTLLDTIILNEGLTTIGINAFASTAITELVLPNSVTTVASSTNYNYSIVEGCQKLKRFVYGDGVTMVTPHMFQGLTALEEVVLGKNTTTIRAYAFDGCISLASIILPDSVVTIENYAFRESGLANIVMNSVTSIGSYAFDGCASLTSINLPESLVTVSSYAFRNSGLKNITIPKNVTTIGDYAFTSCKNLEYLLIEGTALKTIGKNVTSSCPSARRIYYKGTISDWNAISINATNVAPFNKIPYIYSNQSPAEEGNYWYYSASGKPVVWDITLSEYKVYALSNAYSGTMGSSLLSCSTGYIKEMEADTDFMVQKALYDAATIISDLGEALENQMDKEQLYMIVLLDILGYNNANGAEIPEMATTIMKYGSFVSAYIVKADDIIDVETFKELYPALDKVGTALDVFANLTETAIDRDRAQQNLFGFAMQCQNSIDILKKIESDTSVDKSLRNAATKVIDIITRAFDGTLEELIDSNANVEVVGTLTTTAVSVLWDIGCEAYLPAKIAQWVATGVKISLDLFYDTGVSVDAYYKLKVTSVIENALRNQITALSDDYLRRENLAQSSMLYAVIDLYCSAITKGYEYTLTYLDSMDKDSDYILSSYNHNAEAFIQYELEVVNEYYSLYAYL